METPNLMCRLIYNWPTEKQYFEA